MQGLSVMRPRKTLLEQSGSGFIYWVQWVLAQVLTGSILWGLAWIEYSEFPAQYRGLLILSCVVSVPVTLILSPYRKDLSSVQGGLRIALTWMVVLFSCWLSAGFTSSQDMFDVATLKYWAVASLCVQLLAYVPVHHLARYYRQRLMGDAGIVVYGAGDLASSVAERLLRAERGRFLGVVSSDESSDTCFSYPVLGNQHDLQAVIKRCKVGRLYIALPLSDAQKIESLYLELLDSSVDVIWVPDIDSLVLLNHSVTELDGLPVISLNESPLTRYPLAALMKSVLDRTLSLFGLVALSPLLLLIGVAIKLTSKGPVIFKQKRHGWNGQVIEVWKFRSMRVHEDLKVAQATRDDPRITAIGRFIRRSSLDELPQLINVLQGRMSLVGPRPHAVAHNDYYSDKIMAYMARHRIKPGITGLAQVSGYRGETETIDKMEKRVEFDLNYINNWSLWLDIKILFKTPLSLFCKDIY